MNILVQYYASVEIDEAINRLTSFEGAYSQDSTFNKQYESYIDKKFSYMSFQWNTFFVDMVYNSLQVNNHYSVAMVQDLMARLFEDILQGKEIDENFICLRNFEYFMKPKFQAIIKYMKQDDSFGAVLNIFTKAIALIFPQKHLYTNTSLNNGSLLEIECDYYNLSEDMDFSDIYASIDFFNGDSDFNPYEVSFDYDYTEYKYDYDEVFCAALRYIDYELSTYTDWSEFEKMTYLYNLQRIIECYQMYDGALEKLEELEWNFQKDEVTYVEELTELMANRKVYRSLDVYEESIRQTLAELMKKYDFEQVHKNLKTTFKFMYPNIKIVVEGVSSNYSYHFYKGQEYLLNVSMLSQSAVHNRFNAPIYIPRNVKDPVLQSKLLQQLLKDYYDIHFYIGTTAQSVITEAFEKIKHKNIVLLNDSHLCITSCYDSYKISHIASEEKFEFSTGISDIEMPKW